MSFWHSCFGTQNQLGLDHSATTGGSYKPCQCLKHQFLQDESSDLGDSCQQEDEEGFEDELSNDDDNSDDEYDDEEEVQVIDGQKIYEQTGNLGLS